MPKQSAGLLLYRRRPDGTEILLVHPGGPFWAKKDAGAWSLPKGECEPGEEPLHAAVRELREETGLTAEGPFLELGTVKLAGGKTIHGFAAAGDCDPATVRSNIFSLEWPPRSGRTQEFPEIDRAAWFSLEAAVPKLHAAQVPFVQSLTDRLISLS